MKELKQEEMIQVNGGIGMVRIISGAFLSWDLAGLAVSGIRAVGNLNWSNAKLYGSSRLSATERL